MKRTCLMFILILCVMFRTAAAEVEMSIEYVTPTPAPISGVVQSGEFAGMSRSELLSLKSRVESAIQSLDALSADPDDLGIWELTYYIDKFKMPTDEAYIRNSRYISGTFSNTATNNSKLNVRLLIDKDDVALMLYEYGDNQVKNGYSHDEDYDIYVLDSSGVKHEFWGYIRPDGNRIFFQKESYFYESESAFLDLLKQGGKLHFYIEECDRRTTQYNFVIEDASGFSAAYDLLMAK